MEIRLLKGKNKKDTLSCTRADGSHTYTQLSAGTAFHDLCHYAVESTMNWHGGFFGTVASGKDIEDFMMKENGKFQISEEGYHSEFLASLVQAAVGTGKVDPDYYNLLREGAENQGLPFPDLPPKKVLRKIIKLAAQLEKAWVDLPVGDSLELEFPEQE